MRPAGASSCSAARCSDTAAEAPTDRAPGAAATLTDNAAAHRYEYRLGAELGWVNYRREAGLTTLSYARVPDALAGHGVGAAMAQAVLEAERARGARVRATCSFIAAYLARHPEFDDLVAPG